MARITDVWANRRPKFNYITKNISKLTEGDRTFPDTCTQKRPIFGPVLVERPFQAMNHVLEGRRQHSKHVLMGLPETLKEHLLAKRLPHHKSATIRSLIIQHTNKRRTRAKYRHRQLFAFKTSYHEGQRNKFGIWHLLI